jgi:hypothetical protein
MKSGRPVSRQFAKRRWRNFGFSRFGQRILKIGPGLIAVIFMDLHATKFVVGRPPRQAMGGRFIGLGLSDLDERGHGALDISGCKHSGDQINLKRLQTQKAYCIIVAQRKHDKVTSNTRPKVSALSGACLRCRTDVLFCGGQAGG